ncbi:MAG: hypothetical protein EA382_11590 [Spirochaetaceae bacterium]|nr:MAG: hypothetical protein EA382_11590 [Spirochaetaceae bacterium]
MRCSPVLLTLSIVLAATAAASVYAQPLAGDPSGVAPPPTADPFPASRVVPIADSAGIGSTVTALAQCGVGYLWIGTPSGLARYDGVAARIYRRSESLVDDRITALFVDSQNVLWVGTASGLLRFDPESDAFSGGLDGFTVTAIAEDSRGALWIGTTDSGVIAYQPESGYAVRIGYDPNAPRSILSDSVTAIETDRRGWVWVGTRSRGITRLSASAAFARRVSEDDVFHIRQSASQPGIRSDRITELLVDTAGRLWVGTANRGYGPWPPDDAAESGGWVDTGGRSVSAFLVDAHGDVLAASGERIDRVLAGEPGRVARSHGHPTVTALLIDRSGTVWIGSETAGVGRLVPPLPGVQTVLAGSGGAWGSDSPTVWSFAEERDATIVVATDRHGLFRFDPDAGTTAAVGALAETPIYGVSVDGDGTLWLARGEHGAVAVDRDGRVQTQLVQTIVGPGLPAEAVFSVAAVDGLVVLGTTSGVILYDRDSARYRFAAAAGADGFVVTTLARSDRRVWVGTDSGSVGLIDLSGESGLDDRFAVGWYDVSDLRVDRIVQPVWSIAERADASLLLAARDGGVIAFERPGRDAAAGDHVSAVRVGGDPPAYGVVDTVDGYWVLTPNDLRFYRYPSGRTEPDEREGERRAAPALRLTRADGLPEGVFAAGALFAASDGSIYVGGTRGAARIDPAVLSGSQWAIDALVPPLAISQIEVDGGNVSAVVAALDLVAPEQTRVEVLLDGYDDQWVAAASGARVTYQDLPAGAYRLHARAVSRNGVVGPAQLVVEFESPRRRRTAAIVGLVVFWTLVTTVAIQIGLTRPADSRRT